MAPWRLPSPALWKDIFEKSGYLAGRGMSASKVAAV